MASLRVGGLSSSNKSSPLRDTRRSQARERARGKEGMETHRQTPTRTQARRNRKKRRDGCSTKNLSVWSVRACHHLSQSSRQSISKLFLPLSKMKPKSKAQQTLAPPAPPPPLPSYRTKKQKTIKTHQSPPSSAEHAAVPPRPSAAAAHGVAHVDGNAAASCLPKTRPAAQFVRRSSRRTETQVVLCACLPLSMQSSFKVSTVGGRWSWLWSGGRRVDSRRGSLGLAGLLWWWSRETKILGLRRGAVCASNVLSHFGGGPVTGGWRVAGLTLDIIRTWV